jgi:hypothetical protein
MSRVFLNFAAVKFKVFLGFEGCTIQSTAKFLPRQRNDAMDEKII